MTITITTSLMIMVLIKSFSVNLLITFYCSILFRGIPVECVRINKVSSPQSIESGSSQSVILDCQFEINKTLDEKLVLKWYHEDDRRPIYQWIISKNSREFSDKIEPFVDKNYSIDDKLTRFRAIRLMNPPSSLSGDYTCDVSSIDNQDSETTKLIIFETAKSFYMNATEVGDGINITCFASGLFPEPELRIFRIQPTNESYSPIEITDRTTINIFREEQSGQYSISLKSNIYENSLSALDLTDHYECRLVLPETDYSKSKQLALQAGWHTRRHTRPHQHNSSHNKFTALGGSIAIRLISITVPKEVIIKGNATLHCNYNTESDQLYSLKWYKRINDRDEEFFSYISSPEHTIHQNSAPGVHIDEQKSSKTGDLIYLYDIDLTSEGSYKCEVSADYTFQTVKLESYLTVIVPPTKPPIILGHKTFYSVGEVISAHCYASYSKPKSKLKWFINEDEAPDYYLISSNDSNDSNDSNSKINFLLKRNHLIAGKLRLRCTAYIDSNIQVSSEEAIINGTNELQSVPLIIGLQSNYILGQYLEVNCTMPSMIDESFEPQLEWFIHNEKANPCFVKRYSIKNTIGLRFRIRQYHLDDNSSLFIKCSATQVLTSQKITQTLQKKNHFYSIVINANPFYSIYSTFFILYLMS